MQSGGDPSAPRDAGLQSRLSSREKQRRQVSEALVLLGRYGTPEEQAAAAKALATTTAADRDLLRTLSPASRP